MTIRAETVTARVSAETKAALEAAALAERRTVSAFVANLLEDWTAQTKDAPAGSAGASKGKPKR